LQKRKSAPQIPRPTEPPRTSGLARAAAGRPMETRIWIDVWDDRGRLEVPDAGRRARRCCRRSRPIWLQTDTPTRAREETKPTIRKAAKMIASKNPVITGCKSIFLHSNGRAALFLPRARARRADSGSVRGAERIRDQSRPRSGKSDWRTGTAAAVNPSAPHSDTRMSATK